MPAPRPSSRGRVRRWPWTAANRSGTRWRRRRTRGQRGRSRGGRAVPCSEGAVIGIPLAAWRAWPARPQAEYQSPRLVVAEDFEPVVGDVEPQAAQLRDEVRVELVQQARVEDGGQVVDLAALD